MIVIIHKGTVYMGRYFNSLERAKFWLKCQNTKRKFKQSENEFICSLSGAKFKFEKLKFNED